jgi:glycerol-3-phosphate dehydrogenase
MADLKDKLFDQSWNYKNRDKIIERLQSTEYDIIIIGGGITGAGVAREAALRDLKIALVDMQDFAAGTSSRSSKLAHGGFRYLKSGEMKLVKESTTERNWLRTHLPHLTRPCPFLLGSWKGMLKKTVVRGGTKIYDFLSDTKQKFKNFKKSKWYNPEQIKDMEPEVRMEGLLGGSIYYDNNIDDARLTIETLKEAVIRGADIVNYCKVNGYVKENGNIVGVKCKDLENDKKFEIKATLVVNATGIWTDDLIEVYPEDQPEPLIRPTKGIHLQYKRDHSKNNMAFAIVSPIDRRVFFILPRGDFTIIGTTDTDFKGDLANPYCDKEDADYIIESAKYYIPSAELGYENILSTYAGIRPLVMQKGKSESQISRKHLIFRSTDNLFTITGGKITTFRRMAQDLLNAIIKEGLFPEGKRSKNFSKQMYLISIDKQAWYDEFKTNGLHLDENIFNYLFQQYGRGALKILELIKQDNTLKKRIDEDADFIKAEVVYSLKYELTPHLIDVFCRRTEMSLFISHKNQLAAAKKVAELMAKEYDWSEEKVKKEIETYIDHIKKTVAFLE